MVFFVCSKCSTSLKKNQAEKHTFQCRSSTFSCIDCNKDFFGDDYKAHTDCISEVEGYSATGWPPPANHNKGEKKQNEWMDIVQATLDKHAHSISPSGRNLLHIISRHDNVPREKPKFINFINNVCPRGVNDSTITEVWTVLEEEWRVGREDSTGIILFELFFVSICMFTLPIAAYYGALKFCTSYLEDVPWHRDILIGVFASTITVWLIISAYVYRAYRDRRNEGQDSKED